MNAKDTIMSEDRIWEIQQGNCFWGDKEKSQAVAEAQAESTWDIALKAGIKEVVEWVKDKLVDEDNPIPIGNPVTVYLRFRTPIDMSLWQSKLEEWGIK